MISREKRPRMLDRTGNEYGRQAWRRRGLVQSISSEAKEQSFLARSMVDIILDRSFWVWKTEGRGQILSLRSTISFTYQRLHNMTWTEDCWEIIEAQQQVNSF